MGTLSTSNPPKKFGMKLFRWAMLWLASFLLCLWLGSCTSSPDLKAVSLYVGAAGTFRDVLQEIDQLYQQQVPNVVVSYQFAGTGIIKEQIVQGEPFDIFVAADPSPMDELEKKGAILPGTRQNFVGNQIALIVPKDSTLPISSFKDLTSDLVKTVSLPVEQVALGIYTKDILVNLGIFTSLQSKVKWAMLDQREVLKAVEAKKVDAGITFLTDAKLSSQVKVVEIAPPNLHRPVKTSLAVLKKSHNMPEAIALINFLKSAEAEAVFQKYGFTVTPNSVAKF